MTFRTGDLIVDVFFPTIITIMIITKTHKTDIKNREINRLTQYYNLINVNNKNNNDTKMGGREQENMGKKLILLNS